MKFQFDTKWGMSLDAFNCFQYEFEGKTRDVYKIGSGPGILLMHEIPGITPEVIRLATILAAEGYTIYLPVLFGVPGKALSNLYAAKEIIHVCISREFYCFSKHKASPITNWLRKLGAFIHKECQGKGVGAIGLCLTGGFVLSLILDEFMVAPVMSEPSLPFPISKQHKAALGISAEDIQTIKRRIQGGLQIKGLRFTCDKVSPEERFTTLRREFGSAGFNAIEIDSSEKNQANPPIPRRAHSVLTADLVLKDGHPTKEALESVLLFFKTHLQG